MLSSAEAAELAVAGQSVSGAPESVPSPHPQLSRTPARATNGNSPNYGDGTLKPGSHTEEILQELGIKDSERTKLILDGALGRDRRDKMNASAKL